MLLRTRFAVLTVTVAVAASTMGVLSAFDVTTPAAQAQDLPRGVLEALQRALEAGVVEPLTSALENEDQRKQLGEKPAVLRKLCKAVESNAYSVARRKSAEAYKLTTELLALAKETEAANAKDADAHWALAHSLVAHGRVTVATKQPVDGTPWIDAANELVAAHGIRPDGGVPLAVAADYLLERGRHDGVDTAPLDAKADEVIKLLSKQYPGSAAALTAAGSQGLARASRIVAKDKSGAQTLVEEALALLAESVAKSSPDIEVATIHNDLVEFALLNGMRVKAEFVTQERQVVRQLAYDPLLSNRWMKTDDPASNMMMQLDTDGRPVRSIDFDWYQWDKLYSMAGSEVGGDNIKGVAKASFEDWQAVFTKIRKKSGLSKGKLGKKLPAGQSFSVRGVRDDGDEYTVKAYFWKSKEGYQRTFNVLIYEWTDQSWEDDPAASLVFESIRELERK